jgi:crotonobetainyl-CoA:carnitine CoA-transferase CaiB-like acyl-CoA transferase
VSALSPLRILELSNGVAGEYCGKLLADFGAEIIKVEQPAIGSDTRRSGPFAAGGDSPEHSGLFAYLNTNKRSVTLDLNTSRDRETLHELIRTVDAIVDDHPPGYLEALGIDPGSYSGTYPALIVCCVTPFGYREPHGAPKAYSLNVFQGSGWGYHSPSEADPARPPLKGAGRFLVDYESGLSAALALAAAFHWRTRSGRGQFIDVSQQESMASLVDYVLGQMVAGTMDVSTRRQAFDLGGPATFFQCLDGYVYLWMSEPAHWNGLHTLMGEPQWMRDFPERWLELHLSKELIDRCRTQIAHWMKDQNRLEVATRAQKLGVPLVPVNTAKDLFESAQLQFRGFFARIEHPTLGPVRYPTVPYRLSATPARIDRRAPLLGEHTDQVVREAARIEARAVSSKPEAPASNTTGQHRCGPLQGLRVLEVTKVWAGPYTGKLLAFLGAEVIRVESLDSLDAPLWREGPQRRAGIPGDQSRQAQRSVEHEDRRRTAPRQRVGQGVGHLHRESSPWRCRQVRTGI